MDQKTQAHGACYRRQGIVAQPLGRLFSVTFLLCLLSPVAAVYGLGTDAGTNIENSATVNFEIGGLAQTPVNSNTTQTRVDELLDIVVVNDDGGAVAVGSPDTGVVLQFTVTNNGNGAEVYRIIADADVAEGGFNPTLDQLYLESNGTPGLQVGSDTAYVSGISDPNLNEDESLVVYVVSNIPGGLSQSDNGDVEVRAVAQTVIDQAGTDDPNNASWPLPGTSYAGLGDGGGDAVVGSSYDLGALLLLSTGRYQVSNAVVTISKSVLSVLDPFGGTTVVPGSVITYQLELSVAGSGTAEAVVISDPLPAELGYVANTLMIDAIAEDDDFAPAGVDGSGYNAGSAEIIVDRGTISGGSPNVLVTFNAEVQ